MVVNPLCNNIANLNFGCKKIRVTLFMTSLEVGGVWYIILIGAAKTLANIEKYTAVMTNGTRYTCKDRVDYPILSAVTLHHHLNVQMLVPRLFLYK